MQLKEVNMKIKFAVLAIALLIFLVGAHIFFGTQTSGIPAGTIIQPVNQFGLINSSKDIQDNVWEPLFDIRVVNGDMVGGSIEYIVHCGNADDHQSQFGYVAFSSVRKGNDYYSNIKAPGTLEALAKSSGTFASLWQITPDVDKVTVEAKFNTNLPDLTHFHIHYKLTMQGLTSMVTIR